MGKDGRGRMRITVRIKSLWGGSKLEISLRVIFLTVCLLPTPNLRTCTLCSTLDQDPTVVGRVLGYNPADCVLSETRPPMFVVAGPVLINKKVVV